MEQQELSAEAGRQRLFDWEARQRSLECLRDHCRASGMFPGDVVLLSGICEFGQQIREEKTSFSVWKIGVRSAARKLNQPPSTVVKARDRLAKRGLLRWLDETIIASWSRVFELPPQSDSVSLRWSDFVDHTQQAGCSRVFTPARQYQEKDQDTWTNTNTNPTTKNQRQSLNSMVQQTQVFENRESVATMERRSAAIDEGTSNAGLEIAEALSQSMATRYEQTIERVLSNALQVMFDAESRVGVREADRCRAMTIERIVRSAIASNAERDLMRVLESIDRTRSFRRTPGAMFVGCAKRRGWE